jgi:hypothetical protein
MKIILPLTLLCVLVTNGLVTAQEPPRVQGFSVVLLLGEMQGTMTPNTARALSAPAQKALSDIKDFLPYKGYRVLDTQWVAGSEFGESKGRIRGVDDKDYEFLLQTFPVEPSARRGTPDSALSRARFALYTPPTGTGRITMIDNTFTIKAGETVVVGTSRLQGESALILLLTAVVHPK